MARIEHIGNATLYLGDCRELLALRLTIGTTNGRPTLRFFHGLGK